ncbi:MAG: hypothetical protein R2763_17305 [Mycobacterium sp.]
MTAYERIRDALESGGYATKDNGHGRLRSQCPAHTSSTAESRPLAVTAIEGKALIYCHAGCDKTSVMAALSLTVADLFDSPKGAEYVYPGGRRTVYTPTSSGRSHRDRPQPPTGDRSRRRSRLYVTQRRTGRARRRAGRRRAGGSAAQGAGKAHLADWYRCAASVTVVADKDRPGRKHAEQVAGHAWPLAPRRCGSSPQRSARSRRRHVAAGKALDGG